MSKTRIVIRRGSLEWLRSQIELGNINEALDEIEKWLKVGGDV